MDNIIITYHYVRDNSEMKGLSTAMFQKQVEWLSKRFRFITFKELIEQQPKDPTCILTFDDGLIDGYDNVLPILKQYNAKATFFIPTQILLGKMLLAQKRHLLLSIMDAIEFTALYNLLVPFGQKITASEDYRRFYPRDDRVTANLKYRLDRYQDVATPILNKIFNKLFNEKKEHQLMYLNRDHLICLLNEGMEVGSHTHTHPHLATLFDIEIKKELVISMEILKQHLGVCPSVISYPFGNYTSEIVDIAKKIRFVAGVTVKPGVNNASTNPFELNRMDCADLIIK